MNYEAPPRAISAIVVAAHYYLTIDGPVDQVDLG
jgi:hypothetical protein